MTTIADTVHVKVEGEEQDTLLSKDDSDSDEDSTVSEEEEMLQSQCALTTCAKLRNASQHRHNDASNETL